MGCIQQLLLPITPLRVAQSKVTPVSKVRNLSIHLDSMHSDTTMSRYIKKSVGICFGILSALRNVRQSVPRPILQTLVSALVLSRLDYGNATLYGLPNSQLHRYQAVLNAAARLIFSWRSQDHITPRLMQLDWLRVHER